jgi:hypothetical protein
MQSVHSIICALNVKQLAAHDGHLFPAAVPIIESSIYVDGTLFGKDDIHEMHASEDKLIQVSPKAETRATDPHDEEQVSSRNATLPKGARVGLLDKTAGWQASVSPQGSYTGHLRY